MWTAFQSAPVSVPHSAASLDTSDILFSVCLFFPYICMFFFRCCCCCCHLIYGSNECGSAISKNQTQTHISKNSIKKCYAVNERRLKNTSTYLCRNVLKMENTNRLCDCNVKCCKIAISCIEIDQSDRSLICVQFEFNVSINKKRGEKHI